MMKFLVTFKMVSGNKEIFEIKRADYGHVASEVMNNERWFGIKGRIVNKDNVESVEIREIEDTEEALELTKEQRYEAGFFT